MKHGMVESAAKAIADVRHKKEWEPLQPDAIAAIKAVAPYIIDMCANEASRFGAHMVMPEILRLKDMFR